MAWSPYKQTIIDYVAKHPGCTKLDVACHVTRHPRRTPSKQYSIVNTAIRHGWIMAVRHGNRYALYVPDDEREP